MWTSNAAKARRGESVRLRHAAIILAALFLTAVAAIAQDNHVRFAIPAEPLADALSAYSILTGIEVLVPARLVAGRHSSAVNGALEAESALQVLLSGTGLVPHYTRWDAFTLVLAVPEVPSAVSHAPRFPGYSAQLQVAITNALCRVRGLQPGSYRLAVRLWMDERGAVTEARLLDSTGDAHRDAQLVQVLRQISLGIAPPPGVPQPSTLLILPQRDKAPICIAQAMDDRP